MKSLEWKQRQLMLLDGNVAGYRLVVMTGGCRCRSYADGVGCSFKSS